MKIIATQADGKTTITIDGDLLISAVAEAKEPLLAALATGRTIEVDLSKVGECDTAGLQLLLMARASARAQGQRFVATTQSATFRAAALRAGIPATCFESLEGSR